MILQKSLFLYYFDLYIITGDGDTTSVLMQVAGGEAFHLDCEDENASLEAEWWRGGKVNA